MKNFRWACLLLLLLTLGNPASVFAQRPPSPPSSPIGAGFPWWKSDLFKTELGLSTDQSDRIDRIWQTSRAELRQEWDELSKLESKLSRMIQNDADEAVLARQIDRVETARASANKTRSLMLVQMMKVLTPEQRARFSTLHQRYQQESQTAPSTPRRRNQ